MPDITIQDYDIEQDGTDLIFKDDTDTVVFRYDLSGSKWNLDDLSISNAPSENTDAARKTDVDTAQSDAESYADTQVSDHANDRPCQVISIVLKL